MGNSGRNIALWVAISLTAIAIFNFYQGSFSSQKKSNPIDFSELVTEVSSGSVVRVLIRGDHVWGRLRDGRHFSSYIPPQQTRFIDRLIDHNVHVKAAPPEESAPSFFHIFLSWFPMLLLVGVWIFFLRQMQNNTGRAIGFGTSRAKLLDEKSSRVTFKDVAGIDEAKEDLEEIVDFLKNPQKFQKLGGKIPKGVLLVGPPGTGKTLLARAIAGEAHVPFFSISGSDFVEMFVGVGASRVRDMFEQGKHNAPCIIFIDEIDAVGRHRGVGLGGGNDEREQTLNQLLVEMDGFQSNEGVILIAATNRPDVLDPALMRPGRFDRQVGVPNPDVAGREKILLVHMKKVSVSSQVEAKIIARGTPGFSGADLANLVNEAALLAARRNKRSVSMSELEEAKDKVMMGSERRSMVMTEDEKRLTAYHESGHAVVAFYSPGSDPIHKATIIPRGRALGMVMRLPETDRISMSRFRLMADLCVAMGGRIAEELIFGPEKVTTGASSDIKMATDIARSMVIEWGMSDKLGFLTYDREGRQEFFMGHSSRGGLPISEETTRLIDQEIKAIVDVSYKKAYEILSTNIEKLHLLAKHLLEYETLTGEEIALLLVKGEFKRSSVDSYDLLSGNSKEKTPEKEPDKTPEKASEKASGKTSKTTSGKIGAPKDGSGNIASQNPRKSPDDTKGIIEEDVTHEAPAKKDKQETFDLSLKAV